MAVILTIVIIIITIVIVTILWISVIISFGHLCHYCLLLVVLSQMSPDPMHWRTAGQNIQG